MSEEIENLSKTTDQPDGVQAPESTPTSPEKPKSSKTSKLILITVVVLLAGVSGFLVYKQISKPKPVNKPADVVLNSAKPQFPNNDSVAGYINYDAKLFKEVKTIGVPQFQSDSPDVNVVIISANVVSYGDSGLYLYDLATNKTFKLTSGGGDPRIMSDHFLVYGSAEGSGSDKRLNAKLLNLQTGETKTIFAAPPEDVAGDFCCSVSLDGFKLAVAQKNKIGVWDIRSDEIKDYQAVLNPIGEGFSRTSANDYAVEMSYARPAWKDNDTIIYADKPATKYVVVGGATTKPAVVTKLSKLSLTDGTSEQIQTGDTGIYNIYVRDGGNKIFINEVPINGFDVQLTMIDSAGINLLLSGMINNNLSISPKGDTVIIFPVLHASGGYVAFDVATKSYGKTLHPAPSDMKQIEQILPKGWFGDNKMILEVTGSDGVKPIEHIAIYNTETDKLEQQTTVK